LPALLFVGCALAQAAWAAAAAAGPAPARAQAAAPVSGLTVGDFVEVRGARPNYVYGFGIVAGLGGTGDSPRGATGALLRRYLENIEGEPLGTDIGSRNVALVAVEAELPPFQRPGTRVDVRVSALGDARSLEGGRLLQTYLRSRGGDETVYAVAQGPVSVDSPQRPLSGRVAGAALVEASVQRGEQDFVVPMRWTVTLVGADPQDPRRRSYRDVAVNCRTIQLILKEPNHRAAAALADQINAAFFNQKAIVDAVLRAIEDRLPAQMSASERQSVLGDIQRFMAPARADDWGTISVRIPHPDVEWRHYAGAAEPYPEVFQNAFRFVTEILNTPVYETTEFRSAPRVVVNQSAQSVAISGAVVTHAGIVRVGTGAWVSLQEGELLSNQLQALQAPFSSEQIVEIILKAHEAGLIEGEVITR
jgi:flagellar basal body P-ring protein FlgI